MGFAIFTSKSFLFLINLIFLAAAAGLAYVGISTIIAYRQYVNLLGNVYVILPSVIILGVAVVMFIIGVIGCCSTIQESVCGLGCFLTLISIIFGAGLAALVLGLVYKDKINPELEKNMNNLFMGYDGKTVESSFVDFIQEQLECCGRKNYTDWEETDFYKSNQSLPLSCCRKNSPDCNPNVAQIKDINTEACETKLEDLIHNILRYSMFVILGFAIIELFAMISMCVILCKPARVQYTCCKRRPRRWNCRKTLKPSLTD
ncbi:hypothetical protein GDO86_002568 [Hymenochirus boettgeri]|uniref:Tetraspanin n=1 Tax=Hymenochirus boettgeri TaxID=247094 RepID=A0A8T2KN23_9PIPI|nr:hypothetical protein GDO86_002568 [Hymenochirus boettgeri]